MWNGKCEKIMCNGGTVAKPVSLNTANHPKYHQSPQSGPQITANHPRTQQWLNVNLIYQCLNVFGKNIILTNVAKLAFGCSYNYVT